MLTTNRKSAASRKLFSPEHDASMVQSCLRDMAAHHGQNDMDIIGAYAELLGMSPRDFRVMLTAEFIGDDETDGAELDENGIGYQRCKGGRRILKAQLVA